MVDTMKRRAIKKWSVTAENGDHWETEIGKVYSTTMENKQGNVTVFSNFWVDAPRDCFSNVGDS